MEQSAGLNGLLSAIGAGPMELEGEFHTVVECSRSAMKGNVPIHTQEIFQCDTHCGHYS